MKMEITFSEVETFLRETHNLPSDCEIVLVYFEDKLINELHDKIGKLKWFAHEKIPAIKTIRAIYANHGKYCGLACAKSAIEDWERFIAHAKTYRVCPVSNTGHNLDWGRKNP